MTATVITPANVADFAHEVPAWATIPEGMAYAVVYGHSLYAVTAIHDLAPEDREGEGLFYTREPLPLPFGPVEVTYKDGSSLLAYRTPDGLSLGKGRDGEPIGLPVSFDDLPGEVASMVPLGPLG